MYIQSPVTTQVVEKNEDIGLSGKFEDSQIIVEMDTRKRDYKKLLSLPRGVQGPWLNERTFEVQELSSLAWPILYRIITADGYDQREGERGHFTVLPQF